MTMAEGATIINNQSVDYGKNLRIPQSLVSAELDGLYGSTVLRDMHQIIQLYDVYDKGADYFAEAKDYTPADIDTYYLPKEQLPENKHFVELNNKETLAQIFTDIRYTKRDNEAMSTTLIAALKNQGFL